MTPAELIALTENNRNRISDVFPQTDQEERNKALRHYLYVTLLRPEVSSRLLPIRPDLARSRLQRYIRAELSNVLGPNGDRFNSNSTRELYDEFIVVLQQHIRNLNERKRGQNKNPNESTTHSPRPVRRKIRRVSRPAPALVPAPAPVPALVLVSVPALVPAPQITGRRRAASHSPPQAVSPSNSNEGVTLLLGDLNNLAIDRRRQRRRIVQHTPTVRINRVRRTPVEAEAAEVAQTQARRRDAAEYAVDRRRNRAAASITEAIRAFGI